MTEALKPCPFCGSKDLSYEEPEKLGTTVECQACGTIGPQGTNDPHGAKNAWNARPTPKTPGDAWQLVMQWMAANGMRENYFPDLPKEAFDDLVARITALTIAPDERTLWQDIRSAPRDASPITVPQVMRYLPYKPDGKRQMGTDGRWQVFNGYGWTNASEDPAFWQPNDVLAAIAKITPPANGGGNG